VLGNAEDLARGRELVLLRQREAEVVEEVLMESRSVTKAMMALTRLADSP
jgi:hypothetical protein